MEYALFKLSGSFSLNTTNTTNSQTNITAVEVSPISIHQTNILNSFYILQVFSDFIFEKQPVTLTEALEVYENISSNAGDNENEFKYSSPISVQLTPLSFVK